MDNTVDNNNSDPKDVEMEQRDPKDVETEQRNPPKAAPRRSWEPHLHRLDSSRKSPMFNLVPRPITETFVPIHSNTGLVQHAPPNAFLTSVTHSLRGVQRIHPNQFPNQVVVPVPTGENFDDKNGTALNSERDEMDVGTDTADDNGDYDDILNNDQSLIASTEMTAPVTEEELLVEDEQMSEEDVKVDVDEIIDAMLSASANDSSNLAGPNETDPVITQQMLKVNSDFLQRPIDEQTLRFGNISIVNGELGEIKNDNWLTDSIIDYYMQLILYRSRQNPQSSPRIYFFQCVFYKLLSSSKGILKVKDTADINIPLLSYEYLLIPAFAHNHWRLIVVHVGNKTITSYNSLDKPDVLIMKNIERYLKSEQEKREVDVTEWEKVNSDKNTVPQQNNGNDCGVFVLQFANYISQRKEFDFSQKNMQYFRERILYECITQQLL